MNGTGGRLECPHSLVADGPLEAHALLALEEALRVDLGLDRLGDCWDPRTEDALKGKFPKCWEWEGDGRGIACIYPWYAGCLADCESQSPSDSECAADCKKYGECKKYDCLSPENCASLGG